MLSCVEQEKLRELEFGTVDAIYRLDDKLRAESVKSSRKMDGKSCQLRQGQ